MSQFYLVMANVNPGLTIADVQNVLQHHVYWYRATNNVWVVDTTHPSTWLFERLSPLTNPSGLLFISRLDPTDRQGWMPKDFWDFIEGRLRDPTRRRSLNPLGGPLR